MPVRPSRALALSFLLATPLAAQGLAGTAWVAERVVARQAFGPRGLPTLRFENGRVAAFDGCNRVMGPVTFTGADGIAVGRLAGTLMACPGELEDQARAIRDGLARAARAVVRGDRLTLLAADGKEIAQFVRQSTALAGTSWELVMINNGQGAVASLLPGSKGALGFLPGGRAGGSVGCNQLTFTWAQRGDTLVLGPVGATRRQCTQPVGIMSQEQALVAALARVRTARLDGDRLELRDAGGALQVSARRGAGGEGGGAPGAAPTPPGGDGMGGEFTYLADAARFTDCRTGQAWPVAMEGAWIDVERAYLAAGRRGKPLYAVIDGQVAQRPKMEGSGTQGTLVVSRLVGTFPLMRCARAKGTASMTNTYWRLVRLGDEAITATSGRREASLTLRGTDPAEQRFSATVGCNQLGGRAVVTGNNVAFTPGPSTMMACPAPLGARERRLVEALSGARSFRIVGETMELRDGSGRASALFEAVYM